MENFEIIFEDSETALSVVESALELGIDAIVESEEGEYTVQFIMEDEESMEIVFGMLEDVGEDLDEDMTEILDDLLEFNMYHMKSGKFSKSPPTSGKREMVKSVGGKKYKIKKWKRGRPTKQTPRKVCGRSARERGLDIRCWDNQNMQ